MSLVGRLWRTIRHLTYHQVVFQVLHRLRRPARLPRIKSAPKTYFVAVLEADKPISWQNDAFTFLNRTVKFEPWIDWNYSALGKLWTYHLVYFDYLNQPGMPPVIGIRLIQKYISSIDTAPISLEAYPTSLRIINWIQFLSRHQIQNEAINRCLMAQATLLSQRLEYHLSGNHLLENGFALLTSALYFRQKRWYKRAARLIQQELMAQILSDGGHYERSVVYHQSLLNQLLAIQLMVKVDTAFSDPSFILFLTDTAATMYSWLENMTFQNGDVPMMNDAAPNLAPTTVQLKRKIDALFLDKVVVPCWLTESGYRMIRTNRYELLANVGTVGPRHQPGHAHADTFSFVLYVDKQPIIVDSGTSTYQSGERRQWERSTAAHNTVTVQGKDSSEVWASFRVGRRAQVKILTDSSAVLRARHDGYQHIGCIHERVWRFGQKDLLIVDQLTHTQAGNRAGLTGTARFYFHPSVQVFQEEKAIQAGPIKISFQSATKPKFTVTTSQIADGFNQTQTGCCLQIVFTTALETRLLISE